MLPRLLLLAITNWKTHCFFNTAAIGALLGQLSIPRVRAMASKYVQHDENGMYNSNTILIYSSELGLRLDLFI